MPARNCMHSLKTHSQYFDAVLSGEKTFEVRRDDRGFQKGDDLLLRNYDPVKLAFIQENGSPTSIDCKAHTIKCQIVWILTGGQMGLEPGYVCMAIRKIS